MSWQDSLELAKALVEGDEPLTYPQVLKMNISLMTGVHERLDGIEDTSKVRDGKRIADAIKVSNLEGRVNVGIGLSVIVGLAGAIAWIISVI